MLSGVISLILSFDFSCKSRKQSKTIRTTRSKEKNQNQRKRKHNIVCLNLPYSKSVKTNIGRKFIKLISNHFPPNHQFVQVFENNTIKLSYFCMLNIKINVHNKKILQPKTTEPQKQCNCLVKEDFPLIGLCLKSSILYQVTMKSSNSKYKQKIYKGICGSTVKKFYQNYKKSFNLIKSKSGTTLSKEYWTLK